MRHILTILAMSCLAGCTSKEQVDDSKHGVGSGSTSSGELTGATSGGGGRGGEATTATTSGGGGQGGEATTATTTSGTGGAGGAPSVCPNASGVYNATP